jgi:hypothetical protein
MKRQMNTCTQYSFLSFSLPRTQLLYNSFWRKIQEAIIIIPISISLFLYERIKAVEILYHEISFIEQSAKKIKPEFFC